MGICGIALSSSIHERGVSKPKILQFVTVTCLNISSWEICVVDGVSYFFIKSFEIVRKKLEWFLIATIFM
jgi:hypothetical protein